MQNNAWRNKNIDAKIRDDGYTEKSALKMLCIILGSSGKPIQTWKTNLRSPDYRRTGGDAESMPRRSQEVQT